MPGYRVHAVNTAPDSENRMHDDRVAAGYGFARGLVPGVTVFGYMTLPVLEHFGEKWLERGAMNVRFKEPVYEGEDVSIEAHEAGGKLEVMLAGGRASGLAWMEHGGAPPASEYADRPLPPEGARPAASHESLAVGTVLGALCKTIDLADARVSAPLPAAIGGDRRAHPAVLLALANEILMRNVVLGPWIHAGSELRNFSTARDGEKLTVRGRVADKYERKGHEFVVLDLLTSGVARAVQQVRHTAIWRPRRG